MLIFDLKDSDFRGVKTIGDDISALVNESKCKCFSWGLCNKEEALVVEVKIGVE